MKPVPCKCCGHYSATDVVKGQLRVQDIPPAVFWRGEYLGNLSPIHIKFVRELAKYEWATPFLLEMICLSEGAKSRQAVAATICHLRPRLPAGMAIENDRDHGYRLILED